MMTSGRSEDLKAELLLLLVVLIWASNYPVAKFSIRQLDVFVFNAVRYVVAAALLLAIFWTTRSSWVPLGRADRPRLVRAGVVAGVLYQIAFIIGLSLTTAGNSAVLMATAPLWTIAISARMHREPIAGRVWVGMGLSLAGVVMIIAGSGRSLSMGGVQIWGDLICLAAAVLWAFNTNLQKPLLGRYSPLQLSLMMMSIGAVGLTVSAVPAAVAGVSAARTRSRPSIRPYRTVQPGEGLRRPASISSSASPRARRRAVPGASATPASSPGWRNGSPNHRSARCAASSRPGSGSEGVVEVIVDSCMCAAASKNAPHLPAQPFEEGSAFGRQSRAGVAASLRLAESATKA